MVSLTLRCSCSPVTAEGKKTVRSVNRRTTMMSSRRKHALTLSYDMFSFLSSAKTVPLDIPVRPRRSLFCTSSVASAHERCVTALPFCQSQPSERPSRCEIPTKLSRRRAVLLASHAGLGAPPNATLKPPARSERSNTNKSEHDPENEDASSPSHCSQAKTLMKKEEPPRSSEQ